MSIWVGRETRLLVQHMTVNGGHLDSVLTQGLDDRIDLIGSQDEVSGCGGLASSSPGEALVDAAVVQASLGPQQAKLDDNGRSFFLRFQPRLSGRFALFFEDETGILNVICSEGVWKRYRRVARASAALLVRGRLERVEGVTNLIAERIDPLPLATQAVKARDFR